MPEHNGAGFVRQAVSCPRGQFGNATHPDRKHGDTLLSFFFLTCKSAYHLHDLSHLNTLPQLTSVEAE